MFKDRFFQSLSVEAIVSGFTNQGECILVKVIGDDEVVFSMLIDSFVSGSDNLAKKALDDNDISCLDLLIWTHPHDDHTLGLEEVIADEAITIKKIVIPDGVIGGASSFSEESMKIISHIINLTQVGLRYKKNVTEVIRAKSGTDLYKNKIFRTVSGGAIDFNVYCFTPSERVVNKRFFSDEDEGGPNDYSIGVILSIKDLVFMLCSDIEDITFSNIDLDAIDLFELPQLIKIPHHGSEGSIKVIEYLESLKSGMNMVKVNETFSELVNSVATNYTNLPKAKVLDRYNQISKNVYKIERQKQNAYSKVAFVFSDLINNIDLKCDVESENFEVY